MFRDIMRRAISAAVAVTSATALCAAAAQAATFRADVVVDDGYFTDQFSAFSYPRITFLNLSDPGFQITAISITGGFIDYVDSTTIVNPAGGGSTPTGGTQSVNFNPDDGCTPVSFGLASFDAGDSFAFRVDPEPNSCTSAVVDWRTRLDPDLVSASATFTGPGIVGSQVLSGSDWTMELKNPQGGTDFTNQQYRLTLTGTIAEEPVGTPEPASMALLGAGILGLGLLRRRG